MSHYDEARGLLRELELRGSVVASDTHAAASKATPVDADEIPLADSASSFSLKKLTWANLKATLATWLNGTNIPVSATKLTSTVSGGGATVEVVKAANSGGGASTKARIGFYAAGTNYVNIDGGYGASAPELSIDIAGALALTLKGTGLAVVGDVSATTSITGPGGAVLMKTSAALTNGAGAAAGTLTNAPAAGNPTKWISIDDNGTIRKIPAW